MCFETALIGPSCLFLVCLLEQHFGFIWRELCRVGLEHCVIGGGGFYALEERLMVFECVHELGVVYEWRAVFVAECFEFGGLVGCCDFEDGIGVEAKNHLPLPSQLAQRLMILEQITR